MCNAIIAHPELLESDPILNYFPKSANAWIEPKKDNYFDNLIIIRQFERLFILLKFKKDFYNHKIEVLVDNARTHSAKVYDINLISKSGGTICPYKQLEWKEKGETKRFNLLDVNGITKGLFNIAKELNLIPIETLSKEIKLDSLRDIVSQHPAFEINTKLEQLSLKYGASIIWCPKFHCELNPIEGFWCFLKNYVRKNNDQKFENLFPLIEISIQKYIESGIHAKLWNRFWDAIAMYDSGKTYEQVLQLLFGAKSQ